MIPGRGRRVQLRPADGRAGRYDPPMSEHHAPSDETTETALPEYVVTNRAFWTHEAAQYVEPGRRSWAEAEPSWGIWGVPESEARILPDVAGLDTIELGCGTCLL